MMNKTDVWDQKYASGNSLNRYPWDKVVSFVFRNFPRNKPRQETNVLEVGFGSGCNLWFCAREGFNCYGIEGSAVAVEHAKQWFAKENLKGNLSQGDFHPLRFDNDFFDLVIDRGSLTCVPLEDCRTSLKEIYRVMKLGGYFCFNPYSNQHTSCIQGQALESGLTKISTGTLVGVGDIKFYSREEVVPLITSVGFKIKEVRHVTEDYQDNEKTPNVHADWFFVLEK